MGRTLVVTNDFPPRRGGIENFVQSLVDAMPPDEVVVYTARMPGSEASTRPARTRYCAIAARCCCPPVGSPGRYDKPLASTTATG